MQCWWCNASAVCVCLCDLAQAPFPGSVWDNAAPGFGVARLGGLLVTSGLLKEKTDPVVSCNCIPKSLTCDHFSFWRFVDRESHINGTLQDADLNT